MNRYFMEFAKQPRITTISSFHEILMKAKYSSETVVPEPAYIC